MNPPKEIGAFEILERLGAGGMGEVFKARDKRLNRFVAIKFLPEAASAQARERFQREAVAIAALNHPNICTLYDTGVQDGQPYLVMELLEGDTLFTRLQREPVAVAQIGQWGVEVADALEAAHAKGILHRDLKPGNIFITGRGAVKVLDFGLAQFALGTAAADAEAPTITTPGPGAAMGPLTAPGTTMGTYAYMSPEQARGEATDARSDIFSLGVVLYEMAGGRAPFKGRTTADLTAQILMLTPPTPSTLRPEIPARLDDIIAQSLEKDPGMRYQSATDLRLSLRRVLGASSSGAGMAASSPASPLRPARRPPRWLWVAIAAAVIVIVGGGLAFWRSRSQPAAGPVQLHFRQLTFSGHVQDAVISPDGKFLAHVDAGPQGTSLHLLAIAGGSDVQIVPPGNGCCQSPSFSPDGSSVYYLQSRVLKAVPVLGGAVRIIAASACSGAGFSADGSRIAFVAGTHHTLLLARPDGSQTRTLSTSGAGSNYASQCSGRELRLPGSHSPAWSPDGRWIAVIRDSHVELVNPEGGHTRELGPEVDGAREASWLPGGKALVLTALAPGGVTPQVWRIAFPSGAAAQLTNDLQGYTLASAAGNGELALIHASPQYSVWAQAKAGGAFQQLPGGGAIQDGASGLAWTPAGGLVSTHWVDGASQIWSELADGSGGRTLVPLGRRPRVAPSGQIVFAIDGGIWRIAPDGTGREALVRSTADGDASMEVLVHGGQDVVYLLKTRAGQSLWSVPAEGGKPRQVWPGHIFADGMAASPSGASVFVIAGGETQATHVPLIIRLDGAKPQATPLAMDFYSMRPPYGWTADGKAITYIKNQGSVDNIWAYPIAGGKPYAITHFTDLRIAAYAFSRDGRLAISRGTPNSDAVLATGLGEKP